MVEEHRSQTDLRPATAVVSSLHSFSSPLAGFVEEWRSDAGVLPLGGSPPARRISSRSVDPLQRVTEQQRETKPKRQTQTKVRTRFLLLEPLRRSGFIFRVSKHLEVWSHNQSLNPEWNIEVQDRSPEGFNLMTPDLYSEHGSYCFIYSFFSSQYLLGVNIVFL